MIGIASTFSQHASLTCHCLENKDTKWIRNVGITQLVTTLLCQEWSWSQVMKCNFHVLIIMVYCFLRFFFFLRTLFLADAITVLYCIVQYYCISAYFYFLIMGTKMLLKIILVRHFYFNVELLVILVYTSQNTQCILDTKYWKGMKYHEISWNSG